MAPKRILDHLLILAGVDTGLNGLTFLARVRPTFLVYLLSLAQVLIQVLTQP
jgi:hypothetical protein